MPQIFDNIEKHLITALSDALGLSERADFCVGYFNLRGWRQVDHLIERWTGGDDHCCRLLIGMQKMPQDQLRSAMSLQGGDVPIDQSTAIVLKRRLAQDFREQLMVGLPTNEDEAGLRRLADQITSRKIIVKLFLRHPLHAKLYLLFRQDPLNPKIGYLGSSNLTLAGLSKQGELNVVGLGKTLMATALARIFEDDRGIATLIICPKNLVRMWEDYRQQYRMRARVLSITQAQRKLPDLPRFRLVVIDESHNLRNRDGSRYRAIAEYISVNDKGQNLQDCAIIVNYDLPWAIIRLIQRAGRVDRIGVLDPTCGSGAFLFAALRILETLYSDCLERMARFIEDHDISKLQTGTGVPSVNHGQDAHATKYQKFFDFRSILSQIEKHTSERYFILKSIIINNLYGVDIMAEAVEICKLRLFLKLVAQVETSDQIEPLPDMDFNIRSGNTLVGYATEDQARKAFTEEAAGKQKQGKLMFGNEADVYKRFEDDLLIIEKAFNQFRAQQTLHGGKVTGRDKQNLRDRLQILDDELDRYLASEYGIATGSYKSKTAYEAAFVKWKASHQPFHWFVEFYGIMHGGGFDVIIGNPPYVELKAITSYCLTGYTCESAGNLYAVMIERSIGLQRGTGSTGFIVPVSSVSTDRYAPLQKLLSARTFHYSSFDDRHSRLFEGLEHIRLCIHLNNGFSDGHGLYSTCYNKWGSEERCHLFQVFSYTAASQSLVCGSMPKLSTTAEEGIIRKIEAEKTSLSHFYSNSRNHSIFYSRKVGYFLQVLNFVPEVLDGRGISRAPSEFKELTFRDTGFAKCALGCLNTNLFYWFVTIFSDCRHVNKREIDAFPIDLSKLSKSMQGQNLADVSTYLMNDLDANSERRKMVFKHDTLKVQCIFPKNSKFIIDQIDKALAQHYGFTDEELDFIINYDIKYRMGRDGGSEEADE